MCTPDPEPKKLILCRCGYAIGFALRGTDRVTRLNVYRWPISPMGQLMIDPSWPVLVVLESGHVRCAHCGSVRRWELSQRALDDLLERRRGRNFGLEANDG